MIRIFTHQEFEMREVVEMLSNELSHEEAPEFVRQLDLYFADAGVTVAILVNLLQSLANEFPDQPERKQRWLDVIQKVRTLDAEDFT